MRLVGRKDTEPAPSIPRTSPAVSRTSALSGPLLSGRAPSTLTYHREGGEAQGRLGAEPAALRQCTPGVRKGLGGWDSAECDRASLRRRASGRTRGRGARRSMASGAQSRRRLGELLLARGFVTDEELGLALAEQESTRQPLGEIVVSRGYLSRPALLR